MNIYLHFYLHLDLLLYLIYFPPFLNYYVRTSSITMMEYDQILHTSIIQYYTQYKYVICKQCCANIKYNLHLYLH